MLAGKTKFVCSRINLKPGYLENIKEFCHLLQCIFIYIEKVNMLLEPPFLREVTTNFVLGKSIAADWQLMQTVKSNQR